MRVNPGRGASLEPSIHDAFEGSGADLPLWRALAARCGGPVLELGVGAGRVALDLQARGCDVIGVDQDAEALAVARSGGLWRGILQPLHMLALDGRVPLIIAPARVLEELEPDGALPALLRACAALLSPGGVFAAQVADPPADDQPLQSMGVVHRLDSQARCGPAEVLWQERLHRERRLREVRVSLRDRVAGGPRLRRVGSLRLHWAELSDWRARLAAAGLREGPGLGRLGAIPEGGALRTLLALAPGNEDPPCP